MTKPIYSGEKWIIDWNNDGRLDGHCWEPGVEADRVDLFLNTPHGQVQLTDPPRGLRASPGNEYVFADKKRMDVRFYATEGFGSIAVGQEVGWYDKLGKLITMKVDGIAVGTQSSPTRPMIPDLHAPVRDSSGNVINWAYELRQGGQNVRQHIDINKLFWTIQVNGQPERLDPNRAVQKNKDMTEGEKLLQPLFADAQKLKKDHFSDSQKRVALLKLEKIAAQWKVKHPPFDPRAEQLTKPILWNGILGAMAKVAGLTPADFPG